MQPVLCRSQTHLLGGRIHLLWDRRVARLCLGDSPTPSTDAPDSACDLSAPAHDSSILYSASAEASRPPPTPLLVGPPRLLCLREGDISQIIRTGSLLHMLATKILVRAKLHVPIFCIHILLGHLGASGSQVPQSFPLWPSIDHWALTSGSFVCS